MDGTPVRLLAIREAPLSVDELLGAVVEPGAGGVCVFVGRVRDEDHARRVSALGYTAHPTAEAELRRVAERVAAEFPVRALAAVHRVGTLSVGEPSVVAAVACAHRADAFAACRRLIDDLKAEVPLWKHQRFADGAEEWVGAP
jgi:molybdopterin synthase catalytic subunit